MIVLAWLNPVLDLMKIVCFQKVWIHHPLDLLPQPHDQLQAADHQAYPRQHQDRAEDYQWANMTSIRSESIYRVYQHGPDFHLKTCT